jgi:4-hydroxybenzoate polyprenyltransferase
MTQIKSLFAFYIHSSLHVSLCYVAFYVVVALYAGFLPAPLELIAVGTATLAGYNVAKYVHLRRDRFPYHYAIKTLTFLCSIIAVFAVLQLGINAVLLFGFCAILTSLYSLPIVLNHSFRQIPILKLITIGMAWSVMAVVLPRILESSKAMEHTTLFSVYENLDWEIISWELTQFSLYVMALCIPFEIRDLKYDSPQLHTLPQLVGIRYSKYIGFVLLAICGLIELTRFQKTPSHVLATLIVVSITAMAIAYADKFKSDYYASFFVESIPLVWLGIYVLVNY